MAGEVYKPKRIMLRGNITETVNLNALVDGSVDLSVSPELAITGMATRHLNADPPGAFIFICHCGHKRRVIHTETNFRCERGGVGDACECKIVWFRKQRKTDELSDEGLPVYEDETVQETVEAIDEYSGKTIKRKIDVPVFIGRPLGEVRAEGLKEKMARTGKDPFAGPNDVVNLKQVGGAKQESKR